MFPSGLNRCVTTEHRHILRAYIALMALSTASIITPTSAASLPIAMPRSGIYAVNGDYCCKVTVRFMQPVCKLFKRPMQNR